jgi:cytoskeletal protein CcmA (bactofilin family)
MFKKTEETEWTRFSKALSGRDKDEAEEAPEAESSSTPAAAPRPAHDEVAAPASLTRPAVSEVSVSPRSPTRASPAQPDEDVESTIGEHTTVDGTFKSESSIRILGSVQGEVESQRSVLVEAQANVNAKVTASAVTVAGQVNGQIYCSGRVEILPSGRVVGEINASVLVMQEGAYFEGHLKMGDRATQVTTPEAQKATAKA